MACISVKERHQQRRSSVRDGKTEHLREWLVTFDEAQSGTAGALTADDGTRSIPPIDTGHPKDPDAKLSGLEANPHENSDRIFVVRGEYTGTGQIGIPVNPLDRPPDISYGYSDATEDYFLDQSSPPKPVTNSAGDPFESNLQRETGDLILTITVNESAFNPVAMDAVKHTTNVQAVVIDGTTYEPGTLKLSAPTAQKVKEHIEQDDVTEDVTYYRVTYVLKARHDGWHDKPLDIGLNEKVGDLANGFKLRPIVDAASLPVKKPVPLDGSGKKKKNVTDTPAELDFKPYKEIDWSGLRFAQEEIWQE